MTIWRRFSCWLLEWAERFYLHAHGWERKSPKPGEYLPPDDYAFRRHDSYVRSHAVNAQKQLTYNPMHGGPRRDPDLPIKRPRVYPDGSLPYADAPFVASQEGGYPMAPRRRFSVERELPIYNTTYKSRITTKR